MVIPIIFETLERLRRILGRRLSRNRFLLVALFFISMWLLSAVLFYYAEHVVGKKPVDFPTSLYWSLITMATVGYGDVVPSTGLGRIVAGATAVLGIVAYTLTVSVIADAFLERSMRKAMGLAPLKKKQVLVIGDDETCLDLIDELIANGLGDVVGWMTPNQPKTQPPVDFMVGDPLSPQDLSKAGIKDANHVILCLIDDAKVLHTALLVKKLNKTAKIHAIVRSSETAELLKEAGVSTVLSVRVLGRAIASAIFEPSVVYFIDEAVSVKGAADVTEVEARGFVGMSLAEAQKRLSEVDKEYRYQVLGIVRGNDLILAPDPGEKIREGDRLLVLRVKKSAASIKLQY
ncbi:ion channel [Pyrofollis japonicus]|uniref:potassium channel family protein n=1 Tax=Pyrofollis japonicus TaxID=3060460 RepID=UPI00295C29C1|nr:ion channel [Pyrofollis japonicus]BEP17234.1 ion channel [Pyrofollis japonicus]